jgi:hypothetical protein
VGFSVVGVNVTLVVAAGGAGDVIAATGRILLAVVGANTLQVCNTCIIYLFCCVFVLFYYYYCCCYCCFVIVAVVIVLSDF